MAKPRTPKHPQDGPDDDRGEPNPQPPGSAALAFGALPGQAFAQANHSLALRTRGQGFVDITGSVSDWLARIGAENGLLTLFIAHTSASLTIQENADPDVRYDLKVALERLAPESSSYRHSMEGPDDMPAHIKAMLTSVSLSIPVIDGRTALGTWQGIYVIEHRSHPHDRKVELHFIGVRQI
jgi:secondary thiamine-phosphate synthase enzyme